MLVAVAVVLSGCATGDGNNQGATTTSPAADEAPASPWDVPLEQRPALFDPCEEIPIEAIEEAIGGAVEPVPEIHRHRPGELFTCTWESDEVRYIITGTWRSRDQFLADPKYDMIDRDSTVLGRSSIRFVNPSGSRDNNCFQVFFTESGAVVVNANLRTPLREFRGERSWKACDVLDSSMDPIVERLPKGDY